MLFPARSIPAFVRKLWITQTEYLGLGDGAALSRCLPQFLQRGLQRLVIAVEVGPRCQSLLVARRFGDGTSRDGAQHDHRNAGRETEDGERDLVTAHGEHGMEEEIDEDGGEHPPRRDVDVPRAFDYRNDCDCGYCREADPQESETDERDLASQQCEAEIQRGQEAEIAERECVPVWAARYAATRI